MVPTVNNTMLFPSKSLKGWVSCYLFLPEKSKTKKPTNKNQRDTGKLLEMMDLTITLIVEEVSEVFTYVQSQVVHITCV